MIDTGIVERHHHMAHIVSILRIYYQLLLLTEKFYHGVQAYLLHAVI
jgi:hypothetical protein